MKKEKINMITDWLDQHGDPETEQFIAKNLAITEKVYAALKQKGWTKVQLAKAIGKNPSEISKWLSGMHNLTLKSLVKLEMALGIELMHTEPVKEYEYIYFGTIESKSELIDKSNDYEPTTEEQVYDIAM